MASLKNIKTEFTNAGWEIERSKTNSRRFIVTSPDGVESTIKMGYTMDEFLTELQKLGVEKYVQTYDITNASTPKSGTKKTTTKKAVVQNKQTIPSNLKARRKAQKKVAQADPVPETDDNVVEVDSIEVEASVKPVVVDDGLEDRMAAYLTAEINYDQKIPTQKDGYYFPNFVKSVLTRVQHGRNCFFAGKSGTGKTEFVESLADCIGQKVVRVNFSVGTTEAHLIGKWTVKNGETIYSLGVLPLAMKYGWWILFDEMDFAMPEHMAVLQPVLEGKPLMLTQDRNQEIIPHENFRIFATGNTKGRGDETQAYVGTGNLNLAFLDRWAIFEFDYTNKEKNIVMNIVDDEKLSEQIVQFFAVLRKTSDEGSIINAVFSTRRLVQLSEALQYGEKLKDALHWEVFTRYDKHEVELLKEVAYDVWDRDHYMKNWKLGDEHQPEPTPLNEDGIEVDGSVSAPVTNAGTEDLPF